MSCGQIDALQARRGGRRCGESSERPLRLRVTLPLPRPPPPVPAAGSQRDPLLTCATLLTFQQIVVGIFVPVLAAAYFTPKGVAHESPSPADRQQPQGRQRACRGRQLSAAYSRLESLGPRASQALQQWCKQSSPVQLGVAAWIVLGNTWLLAKVLTEPVQLF